MNARPNSTHIKSNCYRPTSPAVTKTGFETANSIGNEAISKVLIFSGFKRAYKLHDIILIR